MNLLSLCWSNTTSENSNSGGGGGGGAGSYSSSSNGAFGRDGLLWYHDVGRYGGGEFSMAVVQANRVLEDQSRIESGRFGTFVGVYDGHGGPEAARYVCDNLFRHLQGSYCLPIEFGGFRFTFSLLLRLRLTCVFEVGVVISMRV